MCTSISKIAQIRSITLGVQTSQVSGPIWSDESLPVACSISAMPENDDLDPAASTQMFQAFVDRPEPEGSGKRWLKAALAGAVVAGAVIVLVLVLGG